MILYYFETNSLDVDKVMQMEIKTIKNNRKVKS